MKKLGILAGALLLAVGSTSAFAWGGKGHHTVGAIADRLLEGTNAEKQVQKLLDGDSLERYAVWADCAKGKTYCQSPKWFNDEMRAFAHANPDHHNYHYTDIPFQEKAYSTDSVGADENDIVQIMRQCILVLRGTDTPQTNPHKFTPRLALVLLSHLVGDIHQPLHVGAAYVGKGDVFINPNKDPNADYEETQGGGFLLMTATKGLHSYWDSSLVDKGMKRAEADLPYDYAKSVLAKPHQPAWQTTGDVTEWPRAWADEALPITAKAHAGIKLGRRHKDGDEGEDHWVWTIKEIPDNYEGWALNTAEAQLNKAGHRLAELLKRIWP